jgi:hypothetical protein
MMGLQPRLWGAPSRMLSSSRNHQRHEDTTVMRQVTQVKICLFFFSFFIDIIVQLLGALGATGRSRGQNCKSTTSIA